MLLALAGCAGLGRTTPATDAEFPARTGAVVAIGGALRYDNDPVWSRLVQLAGGDRARFVVLGLASENPQRSAARAAEALEARGATAEVALVEPWETGPANALRASDPALVAKLGRATGVYFTGGRQERIVDLLQPAGQRSPVLEAIWDLRRRGGVIAGTSAGAAIMSRTMFRDATDVMAVMRGTMRDGQETDLGLGFAGPALFIDQHFLRRGRLGRMLPLMLEQGYSRGLGVEEDTAVVIAGGSAEVIGRGGALFVDLAGASSELSQSAFNIAGVRLSYLGDGDRIDLASKAMIPAAVRLNGSTIDPLGADFKPYFSDAPYFLDMLGDGVVVRAMTNLIDSPLAEVRGLAYALSAGSAEPNHDLGFEFRFYKGADTRGWYTSSLGGDSYSLANVYLDVRPVRVADPLFLPAP